MTYRGTSFLMVWFWIWRIIGRIRYSLLLDVRPESFHRYGFDALQHLVYSLWFSYRDIIPQAWFWTWHIIDRIQDCLLFDVKPDLKTFQMHRFVGVCWAFTSSLRGNHSTISMASAWCESQCLWSYQLFKLRCWLTSVHLFDGFLGDQQPFRVLGFTTPTV